MKRLSKQKPVLEGSLKGLGAKEFYSIDKLHGMNLVSGARKFLTPALWKKLDRHKPVSASQLDTIEFALNQVVMNHIDDYPFTCVWVEMLRMQATMNKFFPVPKTCHIMILKKKISSLGNAFYVKEKNLEHDGKIGAITFSSHAIERFLERNPEVAEFGRQYYSPIVYDLLEKATSDAYVRYTNSLLLVMKTSEFHILGYFVMKWCSKSEVWVAKTFLDSDAREAPDLDLPDPLCSLESSLMEIRKSSL